MGNFDYMSSLASEAVYEHAYKFYEQDRLRNILNQLKGSHDFDSNKYHLPIPYVDQLSNEEKKQAIDQLTKKIDSMRKTPAIDLLRDLCWYPLNSCSSEKLDIGVERGFYAVPFYHKKSDGNINIIIAFRGSDNIFNWVDNLREFTGINLWPAINQTLENLQGQIVPNINIQAMSTTTLLLDIAANYTDKVTKLLQKYDVQTRFTGHSLGGYLSICESLRTGLPATVFENPGFPRELKDQEYNHCKKNIREFLSEPNAVNTMGHHAGEIFSIPMDSSKNEYKLNNAIYSKNTEIFGPIKFRISGLSYLINIGEQSLNPIANSINLNRLKESMTQVGYTASISVGSALLLCLLADLASSNNQMTATQQFFTYTTTSIGNLILNGSQQLISHLVEQGIEYLPHYLPFIADTSQSHSMHNMTKRAFTSSGEIQNSFIVLYQGKQALWPQANTKDCQLTENHLKLRYAINGNALAIKSDLSYLVASNYLNLLIKKSAEIVESNQQIELQLRDNENRLEEKKLKFSSCQADIKNCSEKLNQLKNDLEIAGENMTKASTDRENYLSQSKHSQKHLKKLQYDCQNAQKEVDDLKEKLKYSIQKKYSQSKIDLLKQELSIARNSRDKKENLYQRKKHDHESQNVRLLLTEFNTKNSYDKIKKEIESTKIKKTEYDNNKHSIYNKICNLTSEISNLKIKIDFNEKTIKEHEKTIDELKIACGYLNPSHAENILTVSSSNFFNHTTSETHETRRGFNL